MINFFRKIRQNLIDGKNLKKYAIYAIGEILLVGIGILIALQVNTWNEYRKENKQEQQLADKLYEELLEYQNYCNGFLVRSSEEIDLSEFFLKNWKTLNLNKVKTYREKGLSPFLKSLAIKSTFGGFQYFYDPKFPYYSTSVNDGTISILKDKEFINRLDFIYTTGSKRMDGFYDAAGTAGGEIEKHISDEYNTLFIDSNPAILGDWDERSYDLFFHEIRKDGKLKSIFEKKYGLLKFKKFTVKKQILPSIEKAIQYYEKSQYFSSD